MDKPNKGTVAIVGAGPAGLCTARYALQYGLVPTVFEKANALGGVFRGPDAKEPGYAWTGLCTNVTTYTMRFMDFPPKRSETRYPFRTQAETLEYLRDYTRHYGLEQYIHLEHPVASIRYVDCGNGEKKWEVKTGGAVVKEGIYDYLIIATGKNAIPCRPTFKNMDAFKGKIFHSCEYSVLNAKETFKDKHVIVIGGSISGADMTTGIARDAASVAHIVKRYPYLLGRRMPGNSLEPEKSINKRSWELTLLSRYNRPHGISEVLFPTEEFNQQFHAFMGKNCKEQFAHPAYAEDKVDKTLPVIAWISDCYRDAILEDPETKDKIKPYMNVSVREFTSDGIILDNGEEVKGDIILLSTGYKIKIDFFEKSILDTLEFESEDYFQELILYKQVFRPEFPTLGFVGIICTTIWTYLELHARWAIMAFSGVLPYPDAAAVQAGLEEERKLRAMKPRKQYAHDDWVGYSDSVAAAMGVLPDFEELKNSNPELYKKLWFGPMLPEHYALFGPDSERTRETAERVIDEVWQYVNTAD